MRNLLKMPYKAVIFDLDGTLLDTLADIAASCNRVLDSRGFPIHQFEAYRFFVGDGSEMLVRRALPENERHDTAVQSALRAFKKDYGKNWDIKTAPYADIPQLLDTLVQQGIMIAVCSNKPHAFSVLCVEKLLQRWRFHRIIGQSSLYPKKPAPDSALAIAAEMGVAPAEIMFVGDSGVDMQTAVSAGMMPVGAAWGFRPKEELLKNGCRFMANHPLDVLQILEKAFDRTVEAEDS
jgi:phosphoglycolate phosphatase